MYTYFVAPSGSVFLLQDGRRVGIVPSIDAALRALHQLAPRVGKREA
ncbi:MAG TPA: hypothetical protein VFU85_06760 [Nocardioides sp.]|nr:hypothetical protein [Nocardioides sp.]